jgi:hypothetical protein
MQIRCKLIEQQIIDQLAGRLTAAYRHLDPATINRVVLEEYARAVRLVVSY